MQPSPANPSSRDASRRMIRSLDEHRAPGNPSGADALATQGIKTTRFESPACAGCLSDSRKVLQRFAALSQAAFEIIFVLSPDWKTLRILRDGSLGDPREGWMERHVPITEQNACRSTIAHAVATRTMVELEHGLIRTDGTIRRMLSRVVPIRTTGGDLIEWVGASTDITARHEAVRTIADRERRLADLVNTATDGIITIDRHGMIITANPATGRIFDHLPEALLGRHVSTILPAAGRNGCCASLQGLGRETGSPIRTLAIRRDGQRFLVELSFSMIPSADRSRGDIEMCVVIIRDRTEIEAAERRLQTAERLESIGTLAAGLGHDMNTLLLPLRARLDAIEEDGGSEEVRTEVQEIRRGIGFLQDLADGLHQLVVTPTGDAEVFPTTDLTEWWSKAESLLRRAIPKHVRFVVNIPDDLPSVDVPSYRLTQGILNLLVNAGKATSAEGLIILWATEQADGRVAIGVSDNGSGMPESTRHRAFEPFFTTRTRGTGTGLGLSLVRNLVNAVDGELDIESIEGGGTTITITLPATRDAATSAPAETRDLAGLTVRDPRTASLLSHLLEVEGFQPIDLLGEDLVEPEFIHGSESTARPDRVDLLVTDLDSWSPQQDPSVPLAPPLATSLATSLATPTIVVAHSSQRADALDVEGVAFIESNLSFDHLRNALRSAIERVMP